MANLIQNLASSIDVFGPATTWGGTMQWGVDLWGTGFAPNFGIPTRFTEHQTENSPTLVDNNYGFYWLSFYNDQASFVGNGLSESLSDGSTKYLYVLPGGSTNDENAFVPVYTEVISPSSPWTLQVNSSSTWVQT